MKIKNEYVQVNIGDKTYIKRNTILDRFLKRIFDSQIDTIHDEAEINVCFIKFDTPLEYDDINNVAWSDFDVEIFGGTSTETSNINNFDYMSEKNNNLVRITYNYNPFSTTFRYQRQYYGANEFEMFLGRKISAIGFGNARTLFAIVDTNSMGIYIDAAEKIQITRVDLYQSDGIVRGFDYPLHLVNDSAHYNERFGEDIIYTTKAQLYSVGFGNTMGLIEEEYLVENVEVDRDDNSITFNINRSKKLGHYPSENLYPGFYPTSDNSKYLIFKYRLYEIDSQDNVTYLDKYYTMSMPNEVFGNLNIKLKIERL